MRDNRQPEEVLTCFPWVKLVRWGISGAILAPVISFTLFVFLAVAVEIYDHGFAAPFDDMPDSLFWVIRKHFRMMIGFPSSTALYCFSVLAFPGALLGCIMYIILRKREVDLARKVVEKN